MADERLNVLLIEDSDGDARLIREMLADVRGTAYHLEVADRLAAGLERLARGGIDVLLLDLSLPDSQGLETFNRVHEQAPGAPIVVLTGFDDETLATRAVQTGAQDYLVKGHVEGHLLARSMRYAIERQRAAEAVRESEERLRLVIRASNEAVWTWHLATDEVTWNDTVEKLFGYPAGDVEPTLEWRSTLVHPDDRPRVLAGLQTIIDGGGETWSDQYRFLRCDRTYATVVDHAYVMRDGAGKPLRVVGAIMDITEHKQLEDQFRQAQKMEAIGRLAGGVAHDFNNTLSIILGYSDLLLEDAGPEHPIRESVEVIQESVVRAAMLTRQLLAFSRKQVLAPEVLDLNEAVAHMQEMLRRLIGEDVELITHLDPVAARVKADAGQIGQVLMNLAVNARDAMPHGGRLTLATAHVELDGTLTGRHLEVQPGPYVMLSVSDTGCGMDAETQSHLFEPFFTTKEPGKGTGLGLATVYGITKQSGGHIEVHSEPGRGATFEIYLPRLDGAVPSARPADAPAAGPPPGSETILVVEDEPRVRKLVRVTLERKGYTVLEASQGDEALQICEQHPGPLHLLVTDMVMPGVGGRELVERVRTLRPETKVLFISGYLDGAIVQQDTVLANTPFLQKPFTPAALARKVRAILG
jgi:two-component system, cell cycle sensor histidine kinase and response regulator CckA